MIPQLWRSGKGKIIQESGQEGDFGVMEIFFILNVVTIPLYMFVKTHQAIQLKVINLTLKVYFNKADFKIKTWRRVWFMKKFLQMWLQVKAKIEIRSNCKCYSLLAMLNIREGSSWKGELYSTEIQLFIKLKVNLITHLRACSPTSYSYSIPW